MREKREKRGRERLKEKEGYEERRESERKSRLWIERVDRGKRERQRNGRL